MQFGISRRSVGLPLSTSRVCWKMTAEARTRQLAVGNRVQVVKNLLEGITGKVIAKRGDRLLVAPDFASRGIFVEISSSVTAMIDESPEKRPRKSAAAG